MVAQTRYVSGSNKMNKDDHVDNSRWQEFVMEHAQHFNAPVLEQMIKDIKEIEQGMNDIVRPIIRRNDNVINS